MLKICKVKIKTLTKTAKLPVYSSEYSAGADLYSNSEDVTIMPQQTVFIKTGVSIEVPQGHVGLIFARSGLSSKSDLAPANKVGVIDSDYRGELLVALHNHGNTPRVVNFGDRIAQIAIIPYIKADFVVSEDLEKTQRGENGFGSTGK